MNLKTIHLLMMECTSAQDGRRREQLFARRTQARVGRERPVLCQPGTDRALGDVPVETCVQQSLGFSERVAEVERRDGFEDQPEGIGFVLASSTGEAMQTFGAAVDLQRLQAVSPFAFLGGALASAVWADWIQMEGGGC